MQIEDIICQISKQNSEQQIKDIINKKKEVDVFQLLQKQTQIKTVLNTDKLY